MIFHAVIFMIHAGHLYCVAEKTVRLLNQTSYHFEFYEMEVRISPGLWFAWKNFVSSPNKMDHIS